MGVKILDLTLATATEADDFLPIARVSGDLNFKLSTATMAEAGAQAVYQFLYDAGAIDAPTGQSLADLLIALQGTSYIPAFKFNDTRNSQYLALAS